MWKDWPGNSKGVHVVTQRYKMLIPFCNPKVLPGLFPPAVVLHGPAGFGKITLAKKLMLDWMEDNFSQIFKYGFYFSCKELSHVVFKDWPDLQDYTPNILVQAQKILLVVDGFDELRVPRGVLIHSICRDWEEQKPVPILLGSLLKRKMVPKAALLVTMQPRP
ncbi:NACHT, LRR and PYD domains-containing protein 2 [Plecturocebus cupreus]